MLDPVSSMIANRSGPLSQTKTARNESRKSKESLPDITAIAAKIKETDLLSLSVGIKSGAASAAVAAHNPVPAAKTSQWDAVELSFNLNSDPEALKEAVNTVYDQVKSQLEKYYGLTSTNAADATGTDYLPPDNASTQDLLNFFSPENTSNRIVGFATGFFGAYLQNHGDASRQDKVNGFSDLIGGAVLQGLKEAEKILGNFDDLGEIGANIKKTYSLVMKGIEEFRQQFLSEYQIEDAETADASANADSTNQSTTVGE